MIHFANLSRGTLCPHLWFPDEIEPFFLPETRWLRLQSTHCEQKQWERILNNLGPEFLMAVAQDHVIVHDCSEKQRETRAMWQGLSWVRWAINVAWFNLETHEVSRSGHVVTPYWRGQYNQLSDPTVTNLEYYRRFCYSDNIHLESCWGKEFEWDSNNGTLVLVAPGTA